MGMDERLWMAAKNGSLADARMAVADGAYVNIKNDFGVSPLSFAEQHGQQGLFAILKNGAVQN